MADKTDRKILSQKRWAGGISDYLKESAAGQIPDAYYFGRAVNYRDDPQAITLLPGAVKESGSTVTDLLKWADVCPTTLTSFHIGDSGNLYSRTNSAAWANLGQISGSHGNGLAYFTGDDYVYTASDAAISRYGPTQNSPQLTQNFLKAQGGVPQNTASILLASASTMYGHAADSASLDITGNLTIETYFKANSLPGAGSSMTLAGKWDESGATRSYKLDLFGVSGYFGSGVDGSLTISVNTTEAPIDATCTGSAGTQALSATNVSFAVGQVILITQTRGANAGQWERNTIQGYTAGTITLSTPLIGSYLAGAQVRVLKQYTSVTINAGVTWTAKAWSQGTLTGGILAFLANGTFTYAGTVSALGCGYVGGGDGISSSVGAAGQGEARPGVGILSNSPNDTAGGGGNRSGGASPGSGGGGGAHATTGGNGSTAGALSGGQGATTLSGSADLTTMTFGGSGGSGGATNSEGSNVSGNGGGIIFVSAVTIAQSGSGTITVNGLGGSNQTNAGSTGGGAGGSVLLKAQTATLGTNTITSLGGVGGTSSNGGNGGNGGNGRIHLDYLTSFTGTTNPTLNALQDNTLVTTTTIQARLGISNDGTAFEYLTQNVNNLTTGTWNRLSVAWTAASSMAVFYLNAVSLGTATGTKTSISNNVSLLYVGANKTSVIANYFDGLLNDMRIWNNVQSASQIYANNNIQVSASSGGLQAYYKFNSSAADATSNANTLTLVNAPTYSVDVPFAAPTTRLDIDTQNTNTGQTYTLLTAISEANVDTLNFTPVNDPQASVGFYVGSAGTGNWTVTVHDQQNRVVASQTILHANIPSSGFVEFIFATLWRLINGKSYHMHLTVSTGTSTIVTGTTSNFSTAEYATYFGWLVPDTQFHPVVQFQYQPLGGSLTGAMIIGNERYLAVWDGANYLPNFVSFSPGWRVRCFGFWRQYLAVGCWKGGNIEDTDKGRIYFYSGYAPAFDFFIDVPEGQINALFGVDSDLYMFAGYRGILLDYKGGYFYNTGNSSSNKLKRMPLLSAADKAEVYPGALTMWRGYLHFGLYANSSSTTAQRGVYSFGTLNQWYPDTLSYDYVISTGNKGATVSIGLVFPVGQNLLIGWRDGIACGVDVINFSNPPAPSGELQMLIFDNGNIWKNERSFQAKADFLPLNAGESVDVKANIDRKGWVASNPASTDTIGNDTFTKLIFDSGLSREVQIGVDLFATGTTSPTLLGLSLLYNDTGSESMF